MTAPPLRVDFRGETRAASSISARRAATTAKATRDPWVVVAGRTHSSAEGGDMRPAQCQMPAQLSGRCPELAFGNRRDDDGATRTRRRDHEEVRGHREVVQSFFIPDTRVGELCCFSSSDRAERRQHLRQAHRPRARPRPSQLQVVVVSSPLTRVDGPHSRPTSVVNFSSTVSRSRARPW